MLYAIKVLGDTKFVEADAIHHAVNIILRNMNCEESDIDEIVTISDEPVLRPKG